jgi:hypothetical protein
VKEIYVYAGCYIEMEIMLSLITEVQICVAILPNIVDERLALLSHVREVRVKISTFQPAILTEAFSVFLSPSSQVTV